VAEGIPGDGEALVAVLVDRCEAMPDEEVVRLLRPLLDVRTVRPLLEYVAARLDLDDGERQARFEFSAGNLKRTRLEHHSVGNTELEGLARVA
jgi:hypothetical protein